MTEPNECGICGSYTAGGVEVHESCLDDVVLRSAVTDHASEYGRLLAWRDRLIAAGADPEDLEMPDAP